jgi:hypothetical protein
MWMGTETAHMNETLLSSYAAHDHDPNCADIYADLQSMYLLCKSMHMAGFAQSTSTHSLTQARTDLCSSLEVIQGPAERSRIMKQQLKAQADMSIGNFYRSVHRIRSNKDKKEENIVHGAECFLGAPLPEFLPSLARSGAPLPHAQHICDFDIFCEISPHQKISSTRTDQKTLQNPHSIAYIRPNPTGLKPEFLFSETDG